MERLSPNVPCSTCYLTVRTTNSWETYSEDRAVACGRTGKCGMTMAAVVPSEEDIVEQKQRGTIS